MWRLEGSWLSVHGNTRSYKHALPHHFTPVGQAMQTCFDTMQALCGRCTPATAHPSSVYDTCVLCTTRSAPSQASTAYTVRRRHAIPHLLDRPHNCLRTHCKLCMAGLRPPQRAYWVCVVYARCSHAYYLISTPIWPCRRASGHTIAHCIQQLLSALEVHVCMVVQGQPQYVVEA